MLLLLIPPRYVIHFNYRNISILTPSLLLCISYIILKCNYFAISGLRHASIIPISIPNLSNAPSASVFAQPYFIPFISPSVSNAGTPGMSQPHTSKHKIHDLKANPPNLISFQSKERLVTVWYSFIFRHKGIIFSYIFQEVF